VRRRILPHKHYEFRQQSRFDEVGQQFPGKPSGPRARFVYSRHDHMVDKIQLVGFH